MASPELLWKTLLWSLVTIGVYAAVRALHRRQPHWLLSPLPVTAALVSVLALALHEDYADYHRATHWLGLMLGPCLVAFAVPIYERRATLRRHALALGMGVLAGSSLAMLSAWGLAWALDLPEYLRLSLLPRSISTPFAMTVSRDLGGLPELSAIFVLITGILGATLGRWLLRRLPPCSALARGALFGMGAHSVGVKAAHELGAEEGTIAGLVMVLAGLTNVLAATLYVALR